jgi:hypothetical protein
MGIFRWYRVRVANKKGSHGINSRVVVGPGTCPETGFEDINGNFLEADFWGVIGTRPSWQGTNLAAITRTFQDPGAGRES